MKTTFDLSDPIFEATRALAQRQQTTMRALVEEGLRRVLQDAEAAAPPAFKLKDKSVGGGQMLIVDPREWQDAELAYLANTVAKTIEKQKKWLR